MEIIKLVEGTSAGDEKRYRRLVYKSKLASLKTTYENLLQKKIRIDLQIKSVRKKLSKMKTESETFVSGAVQLEGANYDSPTSEDYRILQEAWTPEEILEWAQLQQLLQESETLLEAYEDIPLYEG